MSLSSIQNDDKDGGINVDLLISEIENRPGIYNKDITEFSDQESQMILWCEVTKAVSPAWSEWEFEKKRDKVREVQGKWRMMKQMFAKHRDSRRLLTASGKKKKKYRYFEKMDFLVPFLNTEKYSECTSTSIESQECQEQPNRPSTSSAYQDGIIQNDNMELALALTDRTDAEEKSLAKPDSLQCDLDLSKAEIDENTHFFLMLVPMMRKLTDEQKYFARKAILSTMRQANWVGGGDINQEDYEPPPRRIRIEAESASDVQRNEIDFPNVVGESEPGLVYRFPPITERSADQVEAYQVQAGPSCSNNQPTVQPPLNTNQCRITILQNELKYPECKSSEPDM